MPEFDDSLFNNSLFGRYYGPGELRRKRRGERYMQRHSHPVVCRVAVGAAVVNAQAGRLTHAAATAIGIALAFWPPTRVRGTGGAAAGVASH